MNIYRKRVTLLSLSTALILGMAGCGSSNDPSDPVVDIPLVGNTLYMVDVDLNASNVGIPALIKLGSYETLTDGGSEIVAYDKASKRMFTTNGAENKIDIINIADVINPVLVSQIDLSPYGTGVNSVASKGGKIAVAVETKLEDGLHTSEKGKVVIFDINGVLEQSVIVGYLPDMVTFNEDGTKVIVANEGEPNGDYSVDPIGSIGIVTLADGSYVDINFTDAILTDSTDGIAVRLGDTPSNDQAKDIEPEYIVVSGNYAYVSLQENNAMAKVNLATNTLEYVKSYGAKSWEAASGNTIDIEEEGTILMKSYEGLFGLYMPDTIAAYEVSGTTYVVTANEGDGREYPIDDVNATLETGDTLNDEKKIKKLTLDASIASEYTDENDLKVVIDMGDIDNDGDYDKLYSYGARSFSIWDANGDIVFDSGDEISKKVALYEPELFNQSKGEMDGRSGNKGAEPEALAVGKIGDKTYAFIGLERQNAIMVYDITVPTDAKFVDYYKTGVEGDVSAEGMKFIPAIDSPNGKNLLLVSYEVSGSTVVYEINDLK
ncbi:MAG TPA: alkaline phosphatase [Sulfurovum sp.]|nr:alkaline phosphatase [Sulfurovum sp.]